MGMKDTGFFVPREKLSRFATSYVVDSVTNTLRLYDSPGGQWSRPPAFPDAAAGLVSTADDFFAFGRMMRDRGAYRGKRVLSEASVAAMTTDQLTPEQKAQSDFVPGFWDTRGWGFGTCVVTKADDVVPVPGRFGWDGGLGTSWYSDPKAGIVGILLTQRSWSSPSPPPVQRDFWKAVYGG
jgi:CubicO group peptidase (beta-lactamase class C family)